MVVTTMMMDYMEMETPTTNHTKTTTTTTTTTTSLSSSYQQYMLALQEERRKIQVFHRELPLCLDLVNQAIENCKQHVYSGERSQCAEEDEHQQQTSSEEPVLEEFIPLKRTEQQDEEKSDNNNHKCDEKNVKKVDWLRSVQLWNQHPDSPSQETTPQIKENGGGAFHRFGENKVKVNVKAVSTTTTPSVVKESIPKTITSPTPTASTSSTADNSNKRKEEKDAQLNRKTRRCWSPELHRRFLQALQQLGGSHAATPKQIRELMKVDGLTNDEVKSHLQKYRLHTRRPGPSMPNNGNTEPTQFVLVGGIWVPPQNYAAAGTAKGDSPSTAQERVYVPVAAPTHITLPSHHHQHQKQQERKLLQLSTGSSPSEQKNSRVEHSMGDENAHSGSSAATSSSTETTTASPNF